MKVAIRLASKPSTSIDSVLTSTNGVVESLSNPTESSRYFAALLSNQPPLSNKCGIVGLLLVPCAELVQDDKNNENGDNENDNNGGNNNGGSNGSGSNITPETSRMYLLAVSTHVDTILELWNNGKLDSNQFSDLMKAIRSAASICAAYKRSFISTSGILLALAKLAEGYRRTSQVGGMYDTMTRSASTSTSTTSTYEHNNVLTLAHVEFLQCCILASQYHIAQHFITQNPISAIAPSSSSSTSTSTSTSSTFKNTNIISSESFLRYHYFLGMIHLACDDYTNAISAFEICLTIPSTIVSDITIEARKKMLLTQCLLLHHEDESHYLLSVSESSKKKKGKGGGSKVTATGESGTGAGVLSSLSSSSGKEGDISPLTQKIFELPNAVSSAVHRYFQSSSSGSSPRTMRPYESIVKAFVSLNVSKLTRTLREDEQALVQDGNIGLVKQLLPLMQYRCLRNISNIYEAIPLTKLAKKLGFSSQDSGVVDGVGEMNVNGDNNGNGNSNGVQATESLLLQIAFRQKNSSSSSSPLSQSHIDFTIDSQNSVVYFYEVGFNDDVNDDDDDAAADVVMDRQAREKAQIELTNRVALSMDLAERITKMDIAVTSSSKYQVALARENPEDGDKKSSGGGTGGGTGGGLDQSRSVISEI
jgi:hypothetical protein